MSREVVGQIGAYDVIYVPEKDVIFCKNTVCRYDDLHQALLDSNLEREFIEKSNLPITKQESAISLGCLNTTKSNILSIDKNIKKFKR